MIELNMLSREDRISSHAVSGFKTEAASCLQAGIKTNYLHVIRSKQVPTSFEGKQPVNIQVLLKSDDLLGRVRVA